ncbi:peptidyl-prolyl cis-trans isomerase [Acidiphilium multivorum AIU301]|uniref:Parvulin-like PPIase n=1 Tax=Acidiphilium multivorum (strain DSM 11245 / JCM 8867 / NBRC 100883 / AIU 301) TaxID=926570 RepID=F0J2A3_ACIMA|nr:MULTISPECIES: peptidylprolyl isomerase [Acidiphilium]BAJ81847.1 peptidyl-prolyl cis-trans isomerase [Acidiphilium multivorum AIU301]GAN72826.1 peptidyl-prolyl cis-trans isomerase [Acidiphilium multivorum AIU301]
MKRSLSGYSVGFAFAAVIALGLAGPAQAATGGDAGATAPAAATKAQPAAKAQKDTVVAIVDGHDIHLSDVAKAAQDLPPQLQNAPPQELFPVLLNRLVDERALLVKARKAGTAKDPKVAAEMKAAADQALERAYLRALVEPKLTDAAVKAYYDSHYVKAKQPEEVKARQILVKTQQEAEKIIAQLGKGAKFSALAKKYSIDPGAKNGGELGWFTKDEMVKPFADAAFALKPGTYTKTPVHSQFGWHVIESQGKREKPVPPLADVKDQIRQQITNKAVTAALEDARKGLDIKLFNPDGTPVQGGASAAPAKN